MPETMSRKSMFSAISKLSNVRPGDLKGALPILRRDLRPGELGYVDGGAKKQSWSQWAGEKIARRGQSVVGIDKITLFPGWATRRYKKAADGSTLQDGPFDIELFVSGFAASTRTLQSATRSQRAFLRLARGFASLPKLPGQLPPQDDMPDYSRLLSPSAEDLLRSKHLPPRPTEISDDYQMEQLEESFRDLVAQGENEEGSISSTDSEDSSQASSFVSDSDVIAEIERASLPRISSSTSVSSVVKSDVPADVRRLHANLEARLEPFWASALSGRLIRISVFVSPVRRMSEYESDKNHSEWRPEPLMTQDVSTGPDGAFQKAIQVPWDRLCTHSHARHIQLNNRSIEQELFIRAELLPLPPSQTSSSMSHFTSNDGCDSYDTIMELPSGSIHIPLTHSPIRVISDIDDTVKMSNILSGARVVFHNVFVKELQEVVIPGMGEWYTEMWNRGVRFHYVSNGPFELLPVVNDFFQISHLPLGSIRLRSYGGRSLLNGLLSTPAARKRLGVLGILNALPESQFFLVGDTGEQDLELYASIAAERPHQILAVFVRDASTIADEGPVEFPTGQDSRRLSLDRNLTVKAAKRPAQKRAMSDILSTIPMNSGGAVTPKAKKRTSVNEEFVQEPSGYFTANAPSPSTPLFTSNLSAEPDSPTMSSESSASSRRSSRIWMPGASRQSSLNIVSEAEKRRQDLQARIHKARLEIPRHIPLRIFRRPEECVEAFQILGRMKL